MNTFIDDLLEAVANAAAKNDSENPGHMPHSDNLNDSTSESISSLDNPDLSDTLGNPHLNC